MNYLNLFLIMMKIGLFTFGGGYAMIALIENEFVSKRKWIESDEFLDMVAIAESTPGPIAINAATYIGYKLLGVLGSVIATIAVCIPSFLIIYIISLFIDTFLSLTLVSYAFKGIQICIIYMIFSAGIKMLKSLEKKIFNIIILIIITFLNLSISLFNIHFSSIYIIIISGVLGLIVYSINLLYRRGEH